MDADILDKNEEAALSRITKINQVTHRIDVLQNSVMNITDIYIKKGNIGEELHNVLSILMSRLQDSINQLYIKED